MDGQKPSTSKAPDPNLLEDDFNGDEEESVEFVSDRDDDDDDTILRLLDDDDDSKDAELDIDHDSELRVQHFLADESLAEPEAVGAAPSLKDALSQLLNDFKSKPRSLEPIGVTAAGQPIDVQYETDNAGAEADAQTTAARDQPPANQILNPSTNPNLNPTLEVKTFGDYMRLKRAKLHHQVNVDGKLPEAEKSSAIFAGISVFVNGYTEPPALIIRELMASNGGEYHCYYEHGKTTFVVATSLAAAKVDKLRRGEIYIRPQWITDSIAQGKALPFSEYVLNERDNYAKGTIQQFFSKDAQKGSKADGQSDVCDARHPDFIFRYYARSRLHLISTLAQDMKEFVSDLKSNQATLLKVSPTELDDLGVRCKSERKLDEKVIFHVDLDCFFVSVGLRSRSDLRGKPVAITHSKGADSSSMSEVASCSYEARACGVKNGMLVRHALEQCPQLVFLPYQFEDYCEVSRTIYTILSGYTLELRAVSCDEMYLNCSELCRKHGINDPKVLAEHMRAKIREKTGCPASVGIGMTSLLARLSTRHAKPDGVFWVSADRIPDFIANEKVKDLPGVGYQSLQKIETHFGDLVRCRDMQALSEADLEPAFGKKLASKLYKQCRGEEDDPPGFWEVQPRKSVSCDINYGIRFTQQNEAMQLLTGIGFELERKLARCRMFAGGVTLKLMIRSANAPVETAKFMGHGRCDVYTKSGSLPQPTGKAQALINEIVKLYNKIDPVVVDLRGVGVQCGKLQNGDRKPMSAAVMEMFKPKAAKTALEATTSKAIGGVKGKVDERKRRRWGRSSDEDDDFALANDMRQRNEFVVRPLQTGTTTKNKRAMNAQFGFQPKRMKLDLSLPPALEAELPKYAANFAGAAPQLDGLPKEAVDDERLAQFVASEPTKEAVVGLTEFLVGLLNAGHLTSLSRHATKLLELVQSTRDVHPTWFEAVNVLLHTVDEAAVRRFGAPMLFVDAIDHLQQV